ncbi:hypothetical protein XANCAGTX0491_001422 [Xanthoria calcicola]
MSGTSRHKACNHCRDKKIRCDGGQPCQRCRGSGDNCEYSTQAKPSKLDLTQALEAFNDRLFQAESALAAQHHAPTTQYPALPTASFDADNMAMWSQPPGVLQSTPERNVTPYPVYGQSATSSMDFQPTMDFANTGLYPFAPNPNLAPANIPLPTTRAGSYASSTTDLQQPRDPLITFPLKEFFRDGPDSGALQNSGSVRRNWAESNLSSRITTPGTSNALSEALEALPQHAANDL